MSSSIILLSIISYLFLSFLSSAERCFLINSGVEIPLPFPELQATQEDYQFFQSVFEVGGEYTSSILHAQSWA
ncbi:hypothetical protein BY996DRAFT_7270829 [Phakopsora pachyrhizi]|nr:hypothetical protein BY996DRAFT_7270829 [Phakopsora pachyrhizi]